MGLTPLYRHAGQVLQLHYQMFSFFFSRDSICINIYELFILLLFIKFMHKHVIINQNFQIKIKSAFNRSWWKHRCDAQRSMLQSIRWSRIEQRVPKKRYPCSQNKMLLVQHHSYAFWQKNNRVNTNIRIERLMHRCIYSAIAIDNSRRWAKCRSTQWWHMLSQRIKYIRRDS